MYHLKWKGALMLLQAEVLPARGLLPEAHGRGPHGSGAHAAPPAAHAPAQEVVCIMVILLSEPREDPLGAEWGPYHMRSHEVDMSSSGVLSASLPFLAQEGP
eukprot:8490392-Pyramimonas_sp.AAC.3